MRLPSFQFAVIKPNQQSLDDFLRMLRNVWQTSLMYILNGNLTFGDGTNLDNINGYWANVTAPATPNTDFTITHNIGRVPSGYLVMEKDRACDVYTGSVAATNTQITLRATVASAILRIFILSLLMSFFVYFAEAQVTTVNFSVTATNSQTWSGGSWSTAFKPARGYEGITPVNNCGGGVLTPQKGTLSNTGTGSVVLPSNSCITPAGSAFTFTSCPLPQSECYTQDVIVGTSTPQTVAFTPPPVAVKSSQVTTAYQDSENQAGTGGLYYNLSNGLYRYCSATSSPLTCISWASLGGIPSATVATLPVSSAVNTIYLVTDSITAGSCTAGGGSSLTLCTWNGAAWVPVSSSGGGGVPGGVPIQTQVNSSGTFAGTQCESFDVLNSGPQRLQCDNIITGINPYIDIRAYGARSCNPQTHPCASGDTASINSGSNSATVSVADFINGDGIVIYGAGPANSVTTPTGLSVSNVLATAGTGTENNVLSAAGSTTRCYKIIARDTAGGYSAASSEVCTTTGQPALGAVVVNLTSCTRSGIRVTCTTATPHPALVGAGGEILGEVYIGGGFGTITDASFRGFQEVDTVPDSTHFTFLNNSINTALGATTSATGGTATFYVADYLQWTAVSNAWLYYIYEGASGAETLVGVSRPNSTVAGNTDTKFEYFGSLQANWIFPPWIPTTPPATAANDNLSAFVGSGGGTTTLSLVTTYKGATPANAGATVAGAGVRLDAAPAIRTAASVAGYEAPVYIPNDPAGYNPNSFVVNQFCDLRPYLLSIYQSGPLYLNETLAIGFQFAPIGSVRWTGGENTAFGVASGWGGQPGVTIKEASPGVYDGGGNAITINGINFNSNNANNALLMLIDGVGGAFNNQFNNDNFGTSTSSTDYMGYGLYTRFVAGTWFDKTNLGNGNNNDGGSHNAPFYCKACGDTHIKTGYVVHRGIIWEGGANGNLSVEDTHYNGGGTPFITEFNGGNIQIGYGVSMDTVGHQCVAGFNAKSTIINYGITGQWGSCAPSGYTFNSPSITGSAIQSIQGFALYNNSLMNNWYEFGQRESDGAYVVDSMFQGPGAATVSGLDAFVVNSAPQAAPTCTVSSGGSATTGTYTFEIQPLWSNGAEGIVSAASTPCTLSTGNQTVTINWTAIAGNPVGYRVGSAAGGGYGQACFVNAPTVTCTISSGPVGGPVGINVVPQAGPTMLTAAAAYAPSYVVNGPSAGSVTLSMPVASANSRSLLIPDMTGLVPTTGYQNSVYDNFNRANGSLSSSNWGGTIYGFPSISGNQVTASALQDAIWTAGQFSANQFCQFTVTTLSGSWEACYVRQQYPSAGGYLCMEFPAEYEIGGQTSGGGINSLVSNSSVTGAVGDVVRCEVISGASTSTINMYVNKTLVLTTTDNSWTSGRPGLALNGGSLAMDNWSGGDYHPISQLDMEQDWVVPQHFTSAVTIGATNPSVGTLTNGSLSIGAFSDYLTQGSTPANPSTGYCRFYFDTTSGQMKGLTSSGGSCTPGGISGMTAGQVPIAATASTITSSKPLVGTDANIPTAGTLSGLNAAVCVDANGGLYTAGCTGGAISGLTTGQVPIAGSASSLTSSKNIQGTDANLLSSGTIAAGAGNPLCTDTGSGATTSGCPAATTMVYNTQSATSTTNIAATNMVTSTSALHSYSLSWTISLTTIGTGCGSSTTVNMNAVFTDPNASTSTTELLGTVTIAAGGNGTVGFVAQGTDNILAKSGTAVQYSTSGYTAGTGCTVNPTYQVSPTLVQLW